MISVLMLIMGSIPTNKAYGVTTCKTMESLDRLGAHTFCMSFPARSEVRACSPAGDQQLNFNSNIFTVALYKYSKSHNKLISILAWKSYCKLSIKISNNAIRKLSPDIIWLRDSTLLHFNPSRHNTMYVLELHELVSQKLARQIKRFPREQLVLAPISLTLLEQVTSLNLMNEVVYSPMGIEPSEYLTEESRNRLLLNSEKTNIIKIGYFGKLRPGGYSKGYEDLLKLAVYHQKIGFNSEICFIGVLDSEIFQLHSEIKANQLENFRIKIIPHLSQTDAIRLMYDFNFLVLPKPENPNYSGFPLKALEYAATGVPILAADSKVNRDIFLEQFQPHWYQPGNPQSLHTALLTGLVVAQNKNSGKASIDYALKFSWNKRTSSIYSKCKALASADAKCKFS